MTAPSRGAAPDRGPATATVPVVQFTVRGQTGAPSVGLGRPYTVVFDGNCKVCGRIVRALTKWDERSQLLELVSSQTAGVQARFPWIPARAYTESVQLIGRNGQTWQGARAVEQILDVLPKGRLVSWVFKLPFARPAAERFYRWFARNRYRLGCGEHCTYREELLSYDDQAA
jgi:predicted DCC family thiol-disulfide oxidoreductase YuxK